MTQMRTQTPGYWASDKFNISSEDIEEIYNFLIGVEEPQSIESLVRVVIESRVNEEIKEMQRRLKGRTIYQPQKSYELGEEVVFPNLQFSQGKVTGIRDAENPQFGTFKAVEITFDDRNIREYASALDIDHPLNMANGNSLTQGESFDLEELIATFTPAVKPVLAATLDENEEFICLGDQWFVQALLADINIGHLHLSEAVLEVSGGGPLPPEEMLVHMEMDKSISQAVQTFSLNYNLLNDERFDEVAPPGRVAWFLQRMEPQAVKDVPEPLVYEPMSFDRALLGLQLLQMEREIDDEWSDLASAGMVQPVRMTLTFPHRISGTLPLSSRIKPLFPLGSSQRQLVTLIDDQSGQEIPAWVVAEGRYIYGLESWFAENNVPVGAYINLVPTGEVGRVMIGLERRRRERKEYVRLAYVEDGRLRFESKKRGIGCDYDDLMIVGTDAAAAVEVIAKQSHRKSLVALIADIMPDLGRDGAQNAVHAKTIYSAVNMLRRVPPGVVFADLVRNPAFVSVGDQYWQFEAKKWNG